MSLIKNLQSFFKTRELIPGKDIIKGKEIPSGKTYSKGNRRRYYLHNRLRYNGIYYNAHSRTIEISAAPEEDVIEM
jgi:hypothetical protein